MRGRIFMMSSGTFKARTPVFLQYFCTLTLYVHKVEALVEQLMLETTGSSKAQIKSAQVEDVCTHIKSLAHFQQTSAPALLSFSSPSPTGFAFS